MNYLIIMYKAFEYRIYPTPEQEVLLSKHFGSCRWLYNYGLEKKMLHYTQTGKTLSRYAIQAELPSLKKAEETKWLSEINSQSLQATLIHLDSAYQKFFREKKGFPQFKSRRNKQSFEIPQHVFINKDSVELPKFKEPIKVLFHRPIIGTLKTCWIKRSKTGKYFISMLTDDGMGVPIKPVPDIHNAIGIDVGVKTFVVTSDGQKFDNPRHLTNSLKLLKRVNRAFSRKLVTGQSLSKNAEKSKLVLALIHEKVTNQRKDFLHKLSTKLIRENQTICVEDLNVAGMMKNIKLSRHIQDLGLGMFFSFLKYKSDWYGKNVLECGRFEPSSKLCGVCGNINHKLTLSDRIWTCEKCGTTHDRDENASKNIKNFAFVGIRTDAEVKPVRNAVTASQGRKPVRKSRQRSPAFRVGDVTGILAEK